MSKTLPETIRETPDPAPERTPFDAGEFRRALGAFPTGVTVVTAVGADGVPVGVTANSFNSVSLNPPMILWSLAKSSRSMAAFQTAGHWVVHILAADQEALSNRFAKSGEDKFSGLVTEMGVGSTPMLAGCTARLQCKTAFMYEGGDHVILVGEVLAFDRLAVPSLVFHGGKYALAAGKTDPALLSGSGPRESDISYGEDFLGYLLWRADLQFRSRVLVHLKEQGLDVDSFMILAMLLHRNGRAVDQLIAGMSQSASADVLGLVKTLSERGLLRIDTAGDSATAWLTDSGRESTLLIHAASRALEADMLGRLDPTEGLVLKHALRRFIVQTDAGFPHPWQDDDGEAVALGL